MIIIFYIYRSIKNYSTRRSAEEKIEKKILVGLFFTFIKYDGSFGRRTERSAGRD